MKDLRRLGKKMYKKQKIIIVGAGGFGREVFRWCEGTFDVAGFLTNNSHDLDNLNINVPIIGDPAKYTPNAEDRFIFAIGDVKVKKTLTAGLKSRGAKFINLIHPTAIVSKSAVFGEGVVVCPYVIISEDVKLGDFVMMNFYSSCGHDAIVGSCSILSPYSTLNGFAVLEDNVFLGTHSVITANKRVGRGSSISAGAVVIKNIPPETLTYGVPGKTIKIMEESDD